MSSIADDSFAAVVLIDTKEPDYWLIESVIEVSESKFFKGAVKKEMNFVDWSLKSVVGLVLEPEYCYEQEEHKKSIKSKIESQ